MSLTTYRAGRDETLKKKASRNFPWNLCVWVLSFPKVLDCNLLQVFVFVDIVGTKKAIPFLLCSLDFWWSGRRHSPRQKGRLGWGGQFLVPSRDSAWTICESKLAMLHEKYNCISLYLTFLGYQRHHPPIGRQDQEFPADTVPLHCSGEGGNCCLVSF